MRGKDLFGKSINYDTQGDKNYQTAPSILRQGNQSRRDTCNKHDNVADVAEHEGQQTPNECILYAEEKAYQNDPHSCYSVDQRSKNKISTELSSIGFVFMVS
jgi:hypothetical protein